MNGGRQPGRASKNQKRLANKRLREIEDEVAGYEGRCLFVTDDDGGFCDEPVTNNCHIVSESAVLDGLKDDRTRKVLELQWGVSQWRRLTFSNDRGRLVQESTTFDPSERTTAVACAGRFACKLRAHDDEFQPIDVAEPDFDDPAVRFLSGYRLVLFLADQCHMAIWLHQKWNQSVMRNLKRGDRALWFGEKEKLEKVFRRSESTAKLLGTHWHARKTGGTFDLDVVSAQVLTFRSKLRLAGGVSYGEATAGMVFPVRGNRHKMGVLYLTGESDQAGEDFKRLTEVAKASEESDNYGVTVTHELMTNGWGTMALSPRSYRELNDADRSTVQGLVARQSRQADVVKSIYRRASGGERRRKRQGGPITGFGP